MSIDIVYSKAKSFQVTDVFGARAPTNTSFLVSS